MAMENTGLSVLYGENFQMHAVPYAVFAKTALIIDCRIMAAKKRSPFWRNTFKSIEMLPALW